MFRYDSSGSVVATPVWCQRCSNPGLENYVYHISCPCPYAYIGAGAVDIYAAHHTGRANWLYCPHCGKRLEATDDSATE